MGDTMFKNKFAVMTILFTIMLSTIASASHYTCFYSPEVPDVFYYSSTNGYGTHTLTKVSSTMGKPLVKDPLDARTTLNAYQVRSPNVKFQEIDFEETDLTNPFRKIVRHYSFVSLDQSGGVEFMATDRCFENNGYSLAKKETEQGCNLGGGIIRNRMVKNVLMFDCGSD